MLSGVAARVQAASPMKNVVSGQLVVELRRTASVKTVNADYGTTTLDRISDSSSSVYLLKGPAGAGVKKTARRMAADKRVLYAEPNFIVRPLEGEARHRAWGVSDAEPSPQENAASALNLSSAHDISLGEGATVAVLDTGAQLDHPALKDNVEGVWRYDFVDDDNDPSDSPIGADE